MAKNYASAAVTYVRESYGELRKVIWPTPKETWRYSVIIVGVSIAVALFLAGTDFVLGEVIDLLP